ncbi:MAG: hypothetical protein R3E12_09965 [Candidatus Eisenbacteria bacterium]
MVIAPGREEPASPQLRLLLPTDDLVAARTRLESGGVRYSEAVDAAGEVRALYFRDPDGNLLGFAAPGTTRDWLTEWSLRGSDRVPPSGRIELAIWSGLHGVGLGFALPYSLGSESPSVIGLTMMAAGPLAGFAGYHYAGHARLTRGQARLIETCGDFALWQTVGWGAVADADAEDVLLWSSLATVGGAVVGALVAHDRTVSAGQAGLVNSAASWGAWYGLIGREIAKGSGDVEETRFSPRCS